MIHLQRKSGLELKQVRKQELMQRPWKDVSFFYFISILFYLFILVWFDHSVLLSLSPFTLPPLPLLPPSLPLSPFLPLSPLSGNFLDRTSSEAFFVVNTTRSHVTQSRLDFSPPLFLCQPFYVDRYRFFKNIM